MRRGAQRPHHYHCYNYSCYYHYYYDYYEPAGTDELGCRLPLSFKHLVPIPSVPQITSNDKQGRVPIHTDSPLTPLRCCLFFVWLNSASKAYSSRACFSTCRWHHFRNQSEPFPESAPYPEPAIGAGLKLLWSCCPRRRRPDSMNTFINDADDDGEATRFLMLLARGRVFAGGAAAGDRSEATSEQSCVDSASSGFRPRSNQTQSYDFIGCFGS